MMLLYYFLHYAREDFSYRLRNIPQNALHYVNSNAENSPLIAVDVQKQLSIRYLQHYFSPWNNDAAKDALAYKSTNQQIIREYIRYPGYGINHLHNSQAWVESIVRNMNMENFPNKNSRVITISNINMRVLPTNQPSFGDFYRAGQGYPFDNLQATSLAANTPALVLQKTRDDAWCFIVTHNSNGWVPTTSLAAVDDQFIMHWKTGHYVTLIKNKVSIIDQKKLMRFTGNIGKIFPVDHHFILIAVPDANQKATITKGQLNDLDAEKWPIVAIQKNIAQLMNAMLGVKYGWGGLNHDSDCSLTTMNLFSAFGIWLPRNSTLQGYLPNAIDLRHLSNSEKEKAIVARGIPFLTLLEMPGHVVVYIGKNQGNVMIFQTVWGVHTRHLLGAEGRAIIGSTVITPINLGEKDVNVKKTWLDQIERMVVLGE